MLQVRPTFSESWYRVAGLKVKLRAAAQISRQYYRGERWYVVRDPAGNQYHRLSEPAYRFVGLLDGSRTVEEAWDLAGGHLADDAPTQPEVIQILSQLYSANLIETNVSPDATVLLRRHKSQMKRKMQGRLMNVLFPRIPLWDLDRFLVRWMPVARVLLSKWGAVVWCVVVAAAVLKVVEHWPELRSSAGDAISPNNWIFLWGTFVLIKLIHELGHAFATRRFGGECHELGIMFLVFIPTPYVDASSAWSFPSKWARMFVGAGGMIIELFVAAIMAFVWINTAPGTIWHQLAYNTMLIASVSTILFNANPLLRYDGYYILSDWLEIPNLRQKSTEYTLGLIKRHIFRIKQFTPLPPPVQRFWLFTYCITSSIYRVMIGIAIILMVAFQAPVLGILMALGGVATWLIVPVWKLTKYLLLEPELHRKRGRAIAFSAAVAAVIVVLVGLVPFWMRVNAVGVVEAKQRAVVYAFTPGFVREIKSRDGILLKEGDPIIVCENKELETEIARLSARLRALEARKEQSSVEQEAQRKIDELEIEATQTQLNDALDRKEKLTIRSPIAGRLIAPKLQEYTDQYLPKGQEICRVELTDQLLVRAVVDQRDAEEVAMRPGARTEVMLVSDIDDDKVLIGKDVQLALAASQDVPAALLHGGGGEIAPDARDPQGQTSATKQFQLLVTLDNPNNYYLPGQRAYLRLDLDRKPLMWQWMRRFWQLIQTHSNSKWL